MAVLNDFLLDPTPFNASRLISIPCLYHVLKIEQPSEGPYPQPILGVARWIYNRARQVLQNLVDRGAKLRVDPEVVVEADKWREVSMGDCRLRIVTHIKSDWNLLQLTSNSSPANLPRY